MNTQITFEQQQIFKDAIYEIQASIDAVLYGVQVDSFEHQRRNFEIMIDLSSVFGRVFDSIPAFSNRFRALFKLFNMSRSIFSENKVNLFLSRVKSVLYSWLASLNPLPSSSADSVGLISNDQALVSAPEGLNGLPVSGYIFKALTVYRLHSLKLYSFDQLYQFSQRDLFNLLRVHLKLGSRACYRTIADINESLSLRGFPELLFC